MLLWATVPLGGVAVWVVPLPGLESLPWLAASVLLHVVYTLGLVKANQVGQFSQLYPSRVAWLPCWLPWPSSPAPQG
jgi:hypothetical protein